MANNRLLYKKMSVEELVVLSQKDDFKALEELIRKVQKDVFATLSYMLKSNENLSDLTQEVLYKLAKNIQNLQNPGCFNGWLNHIVTNTYYDYIRKKKRAPEIISLEYSCPALGVELNIDIPDKRSKPMEKCITSECEQNIKKAIRSLPESFRMAIVLREFQGLSYEEIANTTNSSIGTVKSRISRARVKLHEVLKNYT
ncbi:sigma-70 family RNA polymerase sigma factor [bacterium]|nr:sigma-70 family RNA polymerase sigma factor [bacterium]